MPTGSDILSERVKKVLYSHQIWIESYGKKGRIADLSGLDLRHIDLRKFNLQKANLNKSNLKGSDLSSMNFYSADLQDADLEKAKLKDTRLEEANLARASLRGANLERSDLRGANLTQADLAGVNLEEACLVEADLEQANLESANLSCADLEGALLQNSNLHKAILNCANLEDANLDGANLSEAELEKSNLFCASIDHADFEKANLKNANLDQVEMDENYFVDANLEGVQFDNKKNRSAEMDSIILNNNEKKDGRRLTPDLFTKETGPYINAIAEIHRIIGEARNREISEICVEFVSRGSGVIVELSGAREIITFIKEEVLAWRRLHSLSLARLDEIGKSQTRAANAREMALESLIKNNKHESEKLAAKALKLTAEMMRDEVEAEKIRRMIHQKELTDKFLEKTFFSLTETEKASIQTKLRDCLNLIAESDLAD